MRGPDLIPRRIPKHGRALLSAIQFQAPDLTGLQALDDAEWGRVLRLTDDVQLTLTLSQFCREAMPQWVADRVHGNSGNNATRFKNASSMLLEIAAEFDARGIDYAVLKGFTHSPEFTPNPAMRAQTDCDLLLSLDQLAAGHAALTALGFVPICRSNSRHLPPMVRPTEWQWRGDYFAPDLPISVDLHYKLWDDKAEKIAAPGEENFWARRTAFDLNGKSLPALCLEDRLAFAALHLLMHLLHGDLRLHRAWEIAHFLHHHADDQAFWRSWELLHPPELRKLQALVFQLVTLWFACEIALEAQAEINLLPAPVQSWIEDFAWSPIEGLFRPNRDDLWLHLALVDTGVDKYRVFFARLLPLRMPGLLISKNLGNGPRLQSRRIVHLLQRMVLHLRSVGPTLAKGIGWWWRAQGFSRGFLVYLAGSALFDAGAFIFVLLYNLFLLDCGFRAQLIGQVNGAMTAGTLAAAVPAAWVCRRFGLRNALLIAIAGAAAAACLRALVTAPLPLMAAAFLHGLFFSIWAVCYSPTVASFTTERNRTLGFSITCGMGMSLGIGAGFIGGYVPSMIQSVGASHDALGAKRIALLGAGALILLSAIPISRLGISPQLSHAPEAQTKTLYPRSFFFVSFLAIACVWSLATNAFNPFFNTYFVDRYHMTVERIGTVFSLSQLVQVIAVFLAPGVLRWLGEIKGIAAIQLTAACMLALLVPRFPAYAGAAVFIGYMSFQYMMSPSLFSLTMNHVSKEEQSGASALYFIVTSVAAVASSFVAGAIIEQRGYSQLLAFSALLAVVAAVLTATLLPANRAFAAALPPMRQAIHKID